MRAVLFCILMLSAATAALAADYAVRLKPTEGQRARWENGRQQIDDVGALGVARLMPSKGVVTKRASYNIFVYNSGSAPFDFGPENIEIALADGTLLRMLNYDDLTREERRRQGWQKVGLALTVIARSMAAASAGYSTSTTHVSGSISGSIGRASYSGFGHATGTTTSYDGAAAAAAQMNAFAQNVEDAHRLASDHADDMAAIDNVMQTTTVDPGTAFGGIVFFDLPPAVRAARAAVPISFIVRIGEGTHRFVGSIEQPQRVAKIVPPAMPAKQTDRTRLSEADRARGGSAVGVATAYSDAGQEGLDSKAVYEGDAPRPYRIIGPIKSSMVRGGPWAPEITPARVAEHLLTKARKLGGNGVIRAERGKPHTFSLEWERVDVRGVAVVFDPEPTAPGPG